MSTARSDVRSLQGSGELALTQRLVLWPPATETASNEFRRPGAASQVGFVPHIVPRDGFYCEESWSEWQDLQFFL
jgi:hypothetical protein